MEPTGGDKPIPRQRTGKFSRPLTPRMIAAIEMYATAAAATKHEAARAVGLSPASFYVRSTVDPRINEAIDERRDQITRRAVDMSALLRKLSEKAINKMDELMDTSKSEDIQLRAAIQLADRGPETSKIQRHQVMTMSLEGKDAQAIAEALVKSAQVRHEHVEAASGDFVRIKEQTLGEIPNGSEQPSNGSDS
jgi:hypothetical protein